jgi:hypothetical protein
MQYYNYASDGIDNSLYSVRLHPVSAAIPTRPITMIYSFFINLQRQRHTQAWDLGAANPNSQGWSFEGKLGQLFVGQVTDVRTART